jgi:NADH-quinone oxidoreductase subunit C
MGALAQAVSDKAGQGALFSHQYRGQETVVVSREAWPDLARWLKDDPAMAFDILMDLSCVDYLRFGKSKSSAPTLSTPSPLPYFMKPKPLAETWQRGVTDEAYRFDVVYHFYSTSRNHRLRVRVPLQASLPEVPSVCGLWAGANWFEREAWDMFGIIFTRHPDLRRILMYEEFQGHPLRKDYPINKRQPLIGPVN